MVVHYQHDWAILTGGSGTRLGSVAEEEQGTPVPKQYQRRLPGAAGGWTDLGTLERVRDCLRMHRAEPGTDHAAAVDLARLMADVPCQ